MQFEPAQRARSRPCRPYVRKIQIFRETSKPFTKLLAGVHCMLVIYLVDWRVSRYLALYILLVIWRKPHAVTGA
jgi:hypothetical protein